MRKTGLQMLLASMGIEINPEELMTKYNEAKEIMPKLADFVTKLDARLARIEERLGINDTGGTSVDRVGSIARTGTDNRTGFDFDRVR